MNAENDTDIFGWKRKKRKQSIFFFFQLQMTLVFTAWTSQVDHYCARESIPENFARIYSSFNQTALNIFQACLEHAHATFDCFVHHKNCTCNRTNRPWNMFAVVVVVVVIVFFVAVFALQQLANLSLLLLWSFHLCFSFCHVSNELCTVGGQCGFSRNSLA